MDIVSHGLWGGLAAGRASRRAYWQAFIIGILPDLLSFGLFTIAYSIGIVSGPDWRNGRPDIAHIPQFVHFMYDITHSLIVFSLAFALVWRLRRRPFWPLAAWGVHILVDMPTHSSDFFPTPFLWPLSDYKVPGISWGQPLVFFPNLALLAAGYLWWWLARRKRPPESNDDVSAAAKGSAL